MDRRRKHIDPEVERALRDAFNKDIASHRLSIAGAIKAMRRLSRLTQAEFAKHRGISLVTLKQLESGKGQPKVETLNKVGAIFGLEVAFVQKSKLPQ
ncbi:MAG: helix-turn-helix transcriptional regulator [Sulfuritalea sp.]|nr:helix-turn-helix transcriptional regulator [Sulfuritalea sp.]